MDGYKKTQRKLRFISYLSKGYRKTKDVYIEFMGVKKTAFYGFCILLKETGFYLQKKDCCYWIYKKIKGLKVFLSGQNNKLFANGFVIKKIHFTILLQGIKMKKRDELPRPALNVFTTE